MSSFTDPLVLEYLNGRRWRLARAFTYRVGGPDSADYITVPAGFDTTFASIPRVLWALLPPTGRYGKAAVVHDWLYAAGTRPRSAADLIFRQAMAVLGVSKVKRWGMYVAVRLFGRVAWVRHRAAAGA